MKKTLKSMTAPERQSERGRHRNLLSHLALERMRADTTDARKGQIAAEVVKRRRRMVRLDRQIKIARKTVEVAA